MANINRTQNPVQVIIIITTNSNSNSNSNSEILHTEMDGSGIGPSRGGASSCRAPRQLQTDDKQQFPAKLRSSAGYVSGDFISRL
ncbi:hypothetical protein CcaCcLH18_06295 [Colletotrichum camelliae]|nr:hypothetical protein CcaCcLH18_06295 [Colletotrichum camelliae]